MLIITDIRKKYALKKAHEMVASLSDRQIITTADALERSTDERKRIQSIAIRSVLMGDTEKSFAKACKVYTKTTSEHIRIA